ncbi:protein of unknown function [Mycolicibacterium rutilum]|uniref:DUF1206 domain-containing protein n=1 Tax=Mycolicibacterium rutilum TaxID=370526 RepID=A0A1H6IHW1_MYCRU|nr:DUF1206 domain-containing protein [Mycolicibacterium rutilum]SEH48138.1 protein of unknown function [Mycolicibacterium rutilum]
MSYQDFKGAVNQATGSRVVEYVARSGYPVNGILHLLIAYLIVRIAMGVSGEADQTGALATIAAQRGGNISLWIVAFGLFALAAWRLAETVLGLHPGECTDADERHSPLLNKLKAFGLALVYCALAVTAIQFALGAHRRGSEQAAGLSARLMQSDAGKAVLVVTGIVIAVIGGYFAYKGASRKFLDDLTVPGGRLITVLGVSGHVAEGAVLSLAGLSLIAASFLSEPARATGLDGAVKALGHGEFGKTILIVAALGFAAYGLYSFALTRYARM